MKKWKPKVINNRPTLSRSRSRLYYEDENYWKVEEVTERL